MLGKLTPLQKDDEGQRAVSPVIGVILMVAITVILAAVIASFVLGLGDTDDPAPNIVFEDSLDEDEFEFEMSITSGDSDADAEMLDIVLNGDDGEVTTVDWEAASEDENLGAGSSVLVQNNSNDLEIGDETEDDEAIEDVDEILLIWDGDDQLGSYDIEDAFE